MDTKSGDIIGETVVWSGKWIRTKTISWKHKQDPHHHTRVWEALERTTHGRASVDAVEVIAILKQSGKDDQYIFVRQFRPPVGRDVIELPAGLTEQNETPEYAAVRELKEETGYTGKALFACEECYFGMAVANTSSSIVVVEVNGDLEENKNPAKHCDEGEYTEVVLLRRKQLSEQLNDLRKAGFAIDGKVQLLTMLSHFARDEI